MPMTFLWVIFFLDIKLDPYKISKQKTLTLKKALFLPVIDEAHALKIKN